MARTDPTDIDLLVLDVDGVLTDGTVYLGPDGAETKAFHVRDGSGIKYWQRAGKKVAIITGRSSPAVERRAEELGIDAVRQGAKDKLPALEELLTELDVRAERTAVVGDDLPDVPMMLRCGFAACPADAVEEVCERAGYVATASGGRGCVREIIEMLLERAGLWDGILSRYLPERKAPS